VAPVTAVPMKKSPRWSAGAFFIEVVFAVEDMVCKYGSYSLSATAITPWPERGVMATLSQLRNDDRLTGVPDGVANSECGGVRELEI
jgi:hypothetical protein